MRAPIDPAGIEALTFDCYGTLIDWEGGVRAAAQQLPSLAGCDLDRLVRERDEADRELIAEPWQPYTRVLERSLVRAARRQGRSITRAEARSFAASQASWPPFPEVPAVLARLARRFRLGILSNVEPQVLEASAALLGAPFEVRVTAGDLRSYKPARAHFDEGLRRLGLPAERVLHVACSLFHDVRPAARLGWRVAWVHRGAEPEPADVAPELAVADLAALERALERPQPEAEGAS